MKAVVALVLVDLLALTSAGLAAPPTERIRGTIETVEPGAMTVRTIDGSTATLALSKDLKVSSVVKSSLAAITDGVFVGTATKGEDPPTALEIHLFPESMRGTGEGHRDWDAIPDPLAGTGRVKSAMTNGTVAKSASADGTTMLTLSYDKGQSLTVAVPPQAPIVAFEPADRTALRSGAKVFVVAERDGDTVTAIRIAVGKDGLTPPM